jgi:hypothetical protein
MWYSSKKEQLKTGVNLKKSFEQKKKIRTVKKIAFSCLILLLIIFVIIHFTSIYTGINVFITKDPALTQAIATILTLLVTAYYAFQTHFLINVTSKQRKDYLLPIVTASNFSVNFDEHRDDSICLTCNLKNIGTGPAFNIIISFYDKNSGELVIAAEHALDYIEKDSTEQMHTHIQREVWDNIKYRKHEEDMVADFVIELASHDIFGNHRATIQNFVLDKETKKIQPVLGTFYFEKMA